MYKACWEQPSLQLQQLFVEATEELLDFLAHVRDLFGELASDQSWSKVSAWREVSVLNAIIDLP